ncbi:alpha-glucuronidase [Actinoplanes derwentensis]|uniref:Alpha-glucuronidase n=1 Tax=Actinoplanes derwentensis TaxID=113562 RepID=A0A1H1XH90_9ACTN|nr:alpha-glucuronidase [Actinoplanes derwentensis]GID87169.1 xylan alpha-(1->2)-glucuronosidase [Actinoplanes derwentensis]SDT08046.1 alpha-glucuronidase [Actinoplanes derwentensis]
MTVSDRTPAHPAWLPPEAFRAIGARRVLVLGDGMLVETVREEITVACARFGGQVRHRQDQAGERFDLVLALTGALPAMPTAADAGHPFLGSDAAIATWQYGWRGAPEALGGEGFVLTRREEVTVVLADEPRGLLYGLFEVVRLGESAFGSGLGAAIHRPAMRLRMINHWDNVDAHPVMGQVERGYAGGSLFWQDGLPRRDLARVQAYGRLLAACGINAATVNNVNVHRAETHLLTDRLGEVAAIARVLRPYGVRVHLSVNFAAPIVLGALATADPLDPAVRDWWASATRRVYEAIPDFGGYVVKADSEGQPGPFAYGRSHAEGADMLADAVAPFGGVVHWRAFVYNHRQDWRDRSTDRARAAYDHFVPLDGRFRDNVIVQVKHGPMDFQVREPVSPVIAAMPATRVAVEVQATQEYTGQQRHICYLGPLWSSVLRFAPHGPDGSTVADIVAGGGGFVAVSNAGADHFWTGHPLAQANLYAAGRLAWQPTADPTALLDEWIGLTFNPATGDDAEPVRRTLHLLMDDSWRTYEQYTAPLGIGFMVRPGHHYGPDVDGYEYTPWGTYHFADRDGVGVDRTRASGTGFTGQYPEPWSQIYESLDDCPDELLLFFHHVGFRHVLHNGSTVIQHIYDTHFAGAERVAEMRQQWHELDGLVDPALFTRVVALLEEQVRSAEEWRDQINTYFFRKSGVPDAKGRPIY